MRVLKFLFVFFLSVNCVHLPLFAMENDVQDFRSRPPSLKLVASESLKQATIGVACLYVESHIDSSFEGTPTSYLKIGIKEGSYIYGASCLFSAFNTLVAGLYENVRNYLVEREKKQLETDLERRRGRTLNPIARNRIENRKNQLKKTNSRKEFISCKNYLRYGVDIAQATFIWYNIFNINYESQPIHYSILPVLFSTVDINDKTAVDKWQKDAFVSLAEITAASVSGGLAAYDLWKHWKGEKPTQNTPLRSFFRSLSGLMTFKLVGNRLAQNRDSLPSEAAERGITELNKEADQALSNPFYRKEFLKKFGHMTAEEVLKEFLKNELEDELFYSRILRHSFSFMLRLEFGNGVLSFFEGCKKLYDERNYWFSLVGDLAEEEPTLPSNVEDEKPTKISLSQLKRQKKTYTNESQKDYQEVNLDTPCEQRESGSNEPITPKPEKKKRRGEPNKHISLLTQQSLSPKRSVNADEEGSEKKEEECDQKRRDQLAEIQQMRDSNSVQKNKVKSFYKKAKEFISGNIIKKGNKITINWLRGANSRSVTFETAHKQKNEKASIVKGHKLKAFLDSMEKIYLDGWDKESIVSHLNGRFRLYNLSYNCLELLWTSQEEEKKL